MTDQLPAGLEARIRDAYQGAARTVQPQTLRMTSPPHAGSVAGRRQMNAFTPIAAAAAVILAIGVSVALPRLLAATPGSSTGPAARGTGAAGPYPPFQVVMTANDSSSESTLLVESAATGHVASRLAPPWHGAMWMDVAATADPMRFIAAAAPLSSPYVPARLYTLALSARGAVTGLTPLPVPSLPGQLTSLAASADGSTVAYTMFGPGDTWEAGVITGGRTRQWSVPAGVVAGISHVSVSSDGGMIAFITTGRDGNGFEDTAWVLPASSAPGSLTARARKVYEHTPAGGAGHDPTPLESVLISPDGRTLYVCTAATSAGGTTVTEVTAYSTAGRASRRTIATWGDSRALALTPVGGRLLIWDLGSFEPQPGIPGGGTSDPTAYLINPATRTRTTLRLRGIPRAGYVTLAW